MYKAIWTGRHGFHILFFSWESWTETWAQELESLGCDTLWMRFLEESHIVVFTKDSKQTKPKRIGSLLHDAATLASVTEVWALVLPVPVHFLLKLSQAGSNKQTF